jgi:hypothetical protein
MSDRATGILLGTGIMALCCGAPLLIGTLTTVGLVAALTQLAWLLGPVLLGLLILAGISFIRQRRASRASASMPRRPNERKVAFP